MRKLFGLLILCLSAVAVFAEDNANTIEMVTYFPVPYTSYQQLDVLGRCDVGILRECLLKVDGDIAVDVDIPKTINGTVFYLFDRESQYNWLKNSDLLVSTGRLSLGADHSLLEESTIYANKVWVGDTNGNNPTLKFSHKLELSTLTVPSNNGQMGLKVNDTATVSTLKLGNLPFPQCNYGNKKVKWKRLLIDTKLAVFLVCGE